MGRVPGRGTASERDPGEGKSGWGDGEGRPEAGSPSAAWAPGAGFGLRAQEATAGLTEGVTIPDLHF